MKSLLKGSMATYVMRVAVTAGMLAALVMNPRPAYASTITVQSLNDGAANAGNCPGMGCRLRDAIAAANPGDTIEFGLDGPIVLTAGPLVIDKNLSISGPGADHFAIDADGASRAFYINGAYTVSLSGMTIHSGYADYVGGGLYANGATLSMDAMTIRNNDVGVSQGACVGGGGIALLSGAYTIMNSSIHDNEMQASTCTSRGAGIYLSGGTLGLTNTTLAHNVTVNDGVSYEGDGGGLWIGNAATATLNNVTVASNHAGVNGGGLFVDATATALNLKNSIVANNTSATGADCYAAAPAVNSEDYNLIELTSGCTIGGATAHNITGQDPRFLSFWFNGGTTYNLSLRRTSPAIDAGNDATCASTDQRGMSRPRGLNCDMGSSETMPPFSDFDGDYISDPVKWDATYTAWWKRSSDGVWEGEYLGPGSYVRRSDFDGDGKSDPAKFDGTNTLWYVESSTSLLNSLYMGPGAIQFVQGSDFDGDGKSDPGHFNWSTNALWYRGSEDATWHGVYMGPGNHSFVSSSDFDGDGVTDPGTFDSFSADTNTLWYLGSRDGAWHGVYLGAGDYTFVEGSDFDGWSATDPAQFTTSTNTMWYRSSLNGSWNGVWMGPTALQYVAAADFAEEWPATPAGFDGTTKLLWYTAFSTWYSLYMGPGSYEIVN